MGLRMERKFEKIDDFSEELEEQIDEMELDF
jgi:hypothetical protein